MRQTGQEKTTKPQIDDDEEDQTQPASGRKKRGPRVTNAQPASSEKADGTRSFAQKGRKNEVEYQKTQRVLFALRNHAHSTATKLYGIAHQPGHKNPGKQEFLKKMYPTPNCLACEAKGIPVKEDTTHLLRCDSRESRKQIRNATRAEINQEIGASIKGGPKYDPNMLPDWTFPREEQTALAKDHAAVLGNATIQEFVEEFDGNMARLGIIPKSLDRLLKAMGAIPAVAKVTADKIANSSNALRRASSQTRQNSTWRDSSLHARQTRPRCRPARTLSNE